eukprot:m.677301 g.677301  ORF g.677301 m.677301 type:complete len:115 (-) comp58572_c0_seq1:28-372(-)
MKTCKEFTSKATTAHLRLCCDDMREPLAEEGADEDCMKGSQRVLWCGLSMLRTRHLLHPWIRVSVSPLELPELILAALALLDNPKPLAEGCRGVCSASAQPLQRVHLWRRTHTA